MRLGYLYGKLIKKIVQGRCVISSRIDKSSIINGGCSIVHSEIGRYSAVGYQSELINCQVGSFCSIASNAYLGGAEHPLFWVSTSPVFQAVSHSGPQKRFALLPLPKAKTTIIGNDVWIGHRAIVKAGCVIGDGAVIGAGAVVTKDVPPYAIVGGVPAKVIKMRFSDAVINKLLEIRWWSFTEDQLRIIGPLMNDCEKLIQFIEENRRTFV
jgi:acetyltransferase-like isoleucine patch superfamily enzyme